MRDRRSGRSRPEGQHSEKQHASVDSNTSEDQCHPRKVFVGGLAHKTTTQHLCDHFGRFGSIVDAVVLRWPDGRSRGFGYVTYSDSVAAASVLQETHALSGREVDVKRAVPGTNKLFVGGLPQSTTANELREHFEQFGVVSDAVVMIDPATGRSRGFGFVCFLPGPEGAASVAFALEQYANHRIRDKWIEVKSAAPPHKLAGKNGSPSAEELSLAGALPHGVNRPAGLPSPSPSIENREPNERKSDIHTLGSPRKVALPDDSNLGPTLQPPPPGLTALPVSSSYFQNASSQMPWWPAQPWPQPYAPGFGPFTPFGYPNSAAANARSCQDNAVAGFSTDYFRKSSQLDYSGLSPAESLQHNLEQFLRQSTEDKLAWGLNNSSTRNPSVSTTCSAATQAEITQATTLLP